MITNPAGTRKRYKKPTVNTPLNKFLVYLLFAVLMLMVLYPLFVGGD